MAPVVQIVEMLRNRDLSFPRPAAGYKPTVGAREGVM